MSKKLLALLAVGAALMAARGSDVLNRDSLSPMSAVPAPAKVNIDGDLSKWDFTGSQVIYVSEEFFPEENCEFAFFHDRDNLYVAAKVRDASPLMNVHTPSDRYWEGDSFQLRLYTKPNSDHVPSRTNPAEFSDRRLVNCNFLRQSGSGQIFNLFDYTITFAEHAQDPEGVRSAYKLRDGGYDFECAIPWKVLNLDGPPKEGDFIRALFEINYGDRLGLRRVRRTCGCYDKNPGDFGFLNGDTWGRLYFRSQAPAQRQFPAAAELAQAIHGGGGVAIPLDLPVPLTVNIFDPSGKLVREIHQPSGAVVWDGLDNAGSPVPPGEYRYQARSMPQLEAKYLGSTSSSGTPPYGTSDNHGEWGGDHSNPLAVTTDPGGHVFLWPRAELGKAIVRIDDQGKTLWRHIPFFDAAGNFYAMASDNDFLYLIYETTTNKPSIFRLKLSDGSPEFFQPGKKAVELPVENFGKPLGSPLDRPVGFDLAATGLAVDQDHLYVSIFPDDKVLVLDKKDASPIRSVTVPAPRGLAVAQDGSLLVASAKRILKLDKNQPTVLVGDGLEAPWGLAVKKNGNFVVSDLGSSQQVKEFSPDGKLVKTYGKKGGRALSGRYQAGDFMRPAGLAPTDDGGFLVAEHSLPSPITQFDASGKIVKQWFGPGNYAHAVWPDALDPLLIYSMVPGGMLRSILEPSGAWRPDACWMLEEPARGIPPDRQDLRNCFAARPEFAGFLDNIAYPQTFVLDGKQFMSSDSPAHPIVRVEGDQLVPVAFCALRDGKLVLGDAAGVHPLDLKGDKLELNGHVGSHTVGPSGTWWLAGGKRIYKIPFKATQDGAPVFDTAKASVFVADITGENRKLWSTYRTGILGVREDSKGALYVLYTYGGKTPGIGHSSDIAGVFLAKFAPDGKRLWTRGRKAASFAKPGEIYNPWVLAGILGDKLVAISDECGGMIHCYDADGFFRGSLFKDYARGDSDPGPQLFHGENFSGRVQFFPALGKAYVYQGMTDSRAFELLNWQEPTIDASGVVRLERQLQTVEAAESGPAKLKLVKRLPASLADAAFWRDVPGIEFAGTGLKLAVDSKDLAFRFELPGEKAWRNSASSPELAFKYGDAVDLYFGVGNREQPGPGDIRLLLAPVNGKVTLTAMRPVSTLKKPQSYSNPGGFVYKFDYVGPVAGAVVEADGQVVCGRVPLSFLAPLRFDKGATLAFDADRLGADAAGQRTATRSFWHSSGDSQLTMTQDVPTECWLYPKFWGKAEITE